MIFRQQELTIPSGLQHLNAVEKFVEEISDFYNINSTYFGNILISLVEAVKNAVVHGNKEDIHKKVTVRFDSRPTGLSFTVADEGEGFDVSAVPIPVDASDEEADAAPRGIYLIRSLSDGATWKDNGRVLEIQFTISSINYQLSMDRTRALRAYFQTEDQKTARKDG